jgi:hypothetical protein
MPRGTFSVFRQHLGGARSAPEHGGKLLANWTIFVPIGLMILLLSFHHWRQLSRHFSHFTNGRRKQR